MGGEVGERESLMKWYLVLGLAVLGLDGQDTRNVAEPHFPESCAGLSAQLPAPGGALSEASERRPDTARIQGAIDSCAAGKAVQLKGSGASNIFLAGPLHLKSGVTLVDGDVALFASRNPRD
jgi:polygalacturonase